MDSPSHLVDAAAEAGEQFTVIWLALFKNLLGGDCPFPVPKALDVQEDVRTCKRLIDWAVAAGRITPGQQVEVTRWLEQQAEWPDHLARLTKAAGLTGEEWKAQ